MSIGIKELADIFVPMAERFKAKELKHGGSWKTASLGVMAQRIVIMFSLWDENPADEKKCLVDLANQAMLLYLRLEAEE